MICSNSARQPAVGLQVRRAGSKRWLHWLVCITSPHPGVVHFPPIQIFIKIIHWSCHLSSSTFIWLVIATIIHLLTYSKGDSGGPVVLAEGGNYEVHGVTSWGFGCGNRRSPGVLATVFRKLKHPTHWDVALYSSFPAVLDWIVANSDLTPGQDGCPRDWIVYSCVWREI